MNPQPPSTDGSGGKINERALIFLLCLVAAGRVFIFSAAFPFFNITDEEYHLDLLVKYSAGHLPHGLEKLSDETVPCMIIYSSPEYLLAPSHFTDQKYPTPLWLLPPEQTAADFKKRCEIGRQMVNPESGQPPLYYTLTGLCWRLGMAFGIDESSMLFNIRFLNMLALATVVWLGYLTARLVFPDRSLVRLGVPALIAFLPQSAFYAIQNDVLSPICFGAVFFGVARWFQEETITHRQAAIIGLALAASFLTKLSNLPFLVLTGLVIASRMLALARTKGLRHMASPITILGLCAGLPVVVWMVWMKHIFGDFSGAAAKMHILSWEYKPFAEWWHHPIFSPSGLWTYVSGLIGTFWQGELVWHRQPLPWPSLNIVYSLISIAGAGAAILALLFRSVGLNHPQRHTLWMALGCLLAGTVFLAFLSIIYDFHACPYPSREHPYFTSGRLVLGATVPFFLVFTFGLDCMLNRIKAVWVRPLVLTGFILFIFITELATNWPAFSSVYNWYHI